MTKREATLMTKPGGGTNDHTDPVRTQVPGRWCITLSGMMPEGSWRVRLLKFAQVMPEGWKLALAVEGGRVELDCPDTDNQGMLHPRTMVVSRRAPSDREVRRDGQHIRDDVVSCDQQVLG
jgi:hypothetical protein